MHEKNSKNSSLLAEQTWGGRGVEQPNPGILMPASTGSEVLAGTTPSILPAAPARSRAS